MLKLILRFLWPLRDVHDLFEDSISVQAIACLWSRCFDFALFIETQDPNVFFMRVTQHLGRMSRHDELAIRKSRLQFGDHLSLPLRVEMEFDLINQHNAVTGKDGVSIPFEIQKGKPPRNITDECQKVSLTIRELIHAQRDPKLLQCHSHRRLTTDTKPTKTGKALDCSAYCVKRSVGEAWIVESSFILEIFPVSEPRKELSEVNPTF